MFTGCGTALVTPFLEDLSIDEPTFRSLVNRQIEAGIDFLCPCGTTGESPTLKAHEQLRLIPWPVAAARGRVPVLAGAGGNDTAEIIERVANLSKIGVSGVLSVTPYYNKPTQEGLYQHYRAIAESTELPVILYSVQPRTAVNVEVSTVVRLSKIPNIIGIKEASGLVGQMTSILARVPEEFLVLSGDDSLGLPLTALGGRGVISVVANQIPRQFGNLTRAALEGNFGEARLLQRRYQDLMESNFIETSPGPLKFAMGRMGLLKPYYRLPLVLPQPASQQRIEEVLESLGLLSEVKAGAKA